MRRIADGATNAKRRENSGRSRRCRWCCRGWGVRRERPCCARLVLCSPRVAHVLVLVTLVAAPCGLVVRHVIWLHTYVLCSEWRKWVGLDFRPPLFAAQSIIARCHRRTHLYRASMPPRKKAGASSQFDASEVIVMLHAARPGSARPHGCRRLVSQAHARGGWRVGRVERGAAHGCAEDVSAENEAIYLHARGRLSCDGAAPRVS